MTLTTHLFPESFQRRLFRFLTEFNFAYPLNDKGTRFTLLNLLPKDKKELWDREWQNLCEFKGYETCDMLHTSVKHGESDLRYVLSNTFSLFDRHRGRDKIWKRGAFYRFGKARATIYMFPYRKTITLQVVGPEDDRKELFEMLSETLKEVKV